MFFLRLVYEAIKHVTLSRAEKRTNVDLRLSNLKMAVGS